MPWSRVGTFCRAVGLAAVLDVYQSRRTRVNPPIKEAFVSVPWEALVSELRRGGLVAYPTETFYALGCMATTHAAVERVVAAKGRPDDKPLPLIVSDWDMARRFLRLHGVALDLAKHFWPGPLSIVVEVDSSVSPLARDRAGRSAVRMTPHVLAARLCRDAGSPLVSSSANRSGRPPVCRPSELDPELLREARALVLDGLPWPAGGAPSTLVEIVGPDVLRVLREGAVTVQDIVAKGFPVRD
jgi:L-threonylcarbamoyladenylate synthase